MENKNREITGIGDILKSRQRVKPPAYERQDMALRVISELKIPPIKKSSVFKACRDNPPQTILNALNDTKELCKSKNVGWKYFFKILGNKGGEREQV